MADTDSELFVIQTFMSKVAVELRKSDAGTLISNDNLPGCLVEY